MPILNNAKKALRQSKKRAIRNKGIKDNIAYMSKKIRKGLEDKDKTAVNEWTPKIIKAIDKAAGKGILKKNTAARKKSRMMKKINTLK